MPEAPYHVRPSTTPTLPLIRFRQTRHFGALDGWRAVAILGVIWHHTAARAFESPIAQQGRYGVTLFFIISGFLIVTLLLRAAESPAGFSLAKFWGRRALRILPIYYAVLFGYTFLVWQLDETAAGTEFFANLKYFLTFTTNWFVGSGASNHTIFFFSWSLAAEEQFYLIWPLVEVFIRRPWHKYTALVVMVISSQIALAYYGFGHGDAPLAARMLCEVPLGILLGTSLAHLLHNDRGFRVAYRVIGWNGAALTSLLITITGLMIAPSLGLYGDILITVCFLLLIAATVIREDNDLSLPLRWKPIVWIGIVSYGMYMMHMLSVNTIRTASHHFGFESPYVDLIGGAALACLAASVSLFIYERPFLRLKDRLLKD